MSAAFQVCWKAYGRKEEKGEAYAEWLAQAPTVGGEEALRDLVLAALVWQGPIWAKDGWRFAKYFERYLSRRKWEDEPAPAPARAAVPARTQGIIDRMEEWGRTKTGGA